MISNTQDQGWIPKANPFIQPVKQLVGGVTPYQPNARAIVSPGKPSGDVKATEVSGSPSGGWWGAPDMSINPQSSQAFAQKNYSPGFLGGIGDVYKGYGENLGMVPDATSLWEGAQPQSLAELYEGKLKGLGDMEQEQYNIALSRLKGSYGGVKQDLLTNMAARRGGAGAGALTAGLSELGRGYMGGTQDIATQQAMQNIANRERRLGEFMGYSQGDITNEAGWLSGLTNAMGGDWQARQEALGGQAGWMQSQLPYEQFNITTPWQQAAQRASARLSGQTAEQRINAQRRAESMGYLDRLMGWQGQLGGQYGQGQQQWLGYQGQKGASELGGYDPSWLNWTNQ